MIVFVRYVYVAMFTSFCFGVSSRCFKITVSVYSYIGSRERGIPGGKGTPDFTRRG